MDSRSPQIVGKREEIVRHSYNGNASAQPSVRGVESCAVAAPERPFRANGLVHATPRLIPLTKRPREPAVHETMFSSRWPDKADRRRAVRVGAGPSPLTPTANMSTRTILPHRRHYAMSCSSGRHIPAAARGRCVVDYHDGAQQPRPRPVAKPLLPIRQPPLQTSDASRMPIPPRENPREHNTILAQQQCDCRADLTYLTAAGLSGELPIQARRDRARRITQDWFGPVEKAAAVRRPRGPRRCRQSIA